MSSPEQYGTKRMRGVLGSIANIAHHGALLGFDDVHDAMNEIRRLSLPWWDKDECAKLQMKASQDTTQDNPQAVGRALRDTADKPEVRTADIPSAVKTERHSAAQPGNVSNVPKNTPEGAPMTETFDDPWRSSEAERLFSSPVMRNPKLQLHDNGAVSFGAVRLDSKFQLTLTDMYGRQLRAVLSEAFKLGLAVGTGTERKRILKRFDALMQEG